MLNLSTETTTMYIEALCKEVSLDLQFDAGASWHKKCFVDTDNIQTELRRLRNNFVV